MQRAEQLYEVTWLQQQAFINVSPLGFAVCYSYKCARVCKSGQARRLCRVHRALCQTRQLFFHGLITRAMLCLRTG